jgi:Kef-type K+ transport system membrane component KefB
LALGASSSARGHAFIGATLAATSIGIAGRVLRDAGATQSREAKIVLAAAVLDDAASLVLLAFVTAWVGASSSQPTASAIVFVALRALGFLVGGLLVGRLVLPRIFSLLARVAGEEALLVFGLTICLLFAYVANLSGLAPGIGAFTAGLVIQPEDYRPLVRQPGDSLEKLIAPLLAFFVPIFFALTGLKVDVATFLDPRAWLLAGVLILTATAGKLISGLGAGRDASRLVVGVSMIPRGEVSLIFATSGAAALVDGVPLVPSRTFNAIVITVLATAVLPPFALRRALARPNRVSRMPSPLRAEER